MPKEVGRREPWLEYIPSSEVHPGITCEWADGACQEGATVRVAYWDGHEWIAPDYCRRHGNLALLAERQRPTAEEEEVMDERVERFPDVTVRLVGEDGNAFAILGAVTKALRKAGATPEEIREFTDEATSDDYDHLLATVMAWVEVE
jgi:hypothetical protein